MVEAQIIMAEGSEKHRIVCKSYRTRTTINGSSASEETLLSTFLAKYLFGSNVQRNPSCYPSTSDLRASPRSVRTNSPQFPASED